MVGALKLVGFGLLLLATLRRDGGPRFAARPPADRGAVDEGAAGA